MGSANTWVVFKNRPTLRDEDQDQDRKKSVSSGLETKTAVSRTTRLHVIATPNILQVHGVTKSHRRQGFGKFQFNSCVTLAQVSRGLSATAELLANLKQRSLYVIFSTSVVHILLW